MKQYLALSGLNSTALSVSPEAEQVRDELLAQASTIKAVVTAEHAQAASASLKELKGFSRQIDDARSFVKSPVLDLGKRIDAMAKELTIEVEAEASRLSKLIGNYNVEQARIADKARQEALAEEQRIANEAKAKIEQARENGASDAKLEKLEAKAFGQLAVAHAATAATAAPKMAGIATRAEICFEVQDIAALYKAYPMLVTLSPNIQAIKACLKSSPGGLPGVRHWTEQKAIVR